MNLENYVGKVYKVKILRQENKWYIAQNIEDKQIVYIEDTKDFLPEELLEQIEKCLIMEIKQNKLIGSLLNNRKFINDLKRIAKQLKDRNEFHKIKDIYLIERLKIGGRIEGLYFVDEGEIGKYYLGTKEIGTFMKKLRENPIVFKENSIENELAKQIKDIVQSIDLNKKEISLKQEQEEQKHLIEKALQLGRGREITKIATINLREEIKEKKEKDKINPVQQTPLVIKKQYSNLKNVNIKQEMDVDNKVTDMRTLEKLLKDMGKLPKIKGKYFEKIGIIESDERDNLINQKGEKSKVNTTRYSMVAIATDGTVVPLDLEQVHAEGNNPREMNYQVKQDGSVQKDDVLSRFRLGEGSLAIKNGKYGEIKVYHSPRKTIGGKGIEGNKSLDRELETDNIWELKKEERDLAEEYGDGYRSVEESYQEAKKHQDKSGNLIRESKMQTKDIDGERDTKSHVHDKVNYESLAIKWGYYKQGEPNVEKAKEIFAEKRKENPQKETKEIIEMVTEELEEEMGHQRENRF